MNATRWLLGPLSVVYGGAIWGRNLYYDRSRSASRRAAVPVVSIGNLTVGGTGKTPFAIEVVRRLAALGRRPAILTRGYKAAGNTPADEVLEFHDAVPDVPVVVNPDRAAGADMACATHGANCLVLDDGFQHRRLARDLDIVLIDALSPWGGGWLLPAGRLREPRSSLRRADVLVITRSNQVDAATLDTIAADLRRHAGDKPILSATVEADALVDRAGRRTPVRELAGRRVLGVCGLGNPSTFQRLGASLAEACTWCVFADHQRYTAAHVDAIRTTAGRANAELVVTTRKDWVKLEPLWPDAGPELVRLDVRLSLHDGSEVLDAGLRRVLESQR